VEKKRTRTKVSRSGDELSHLKDLVARANRILFHEKLADYHGHVSARVPGTRTMMIKPFLVSLERVRAGDILVLDMDEYHAFLQTRSGESKKSSPMSMAPRETILHLAIYEARPDVQSVVHTHQPLATAFSIAGIPLHPVFFGGARFAPSTPVLQNPRIIDDLPMAREAAQTLGQASGLLLRHHGVVVVGTSVEEATAGAVYLERNAYLQLIATLLGNPASIPEPFIPELAANMNRRAPVSFAYFESLFSK